MTVNAILRLWRSITGLGESVDRLKGIVDTAADLLEERLALEAPKEVPQLEDAAPNGRGKVKVRT